MNQLNIFILSFGALQGILLGMLLLRKKAHRAGFGFLLLYLLTLLFQILMKAASKAWLWYHMREFYLLSYHLPFLYGPLLFLFLNRVAAPQKRGQWRDALHFLPFLYALTMDVCVYQGFSERLPDFLFISSGTALTLHIASLTAYHWFCFRRILQQDCDAGNKAYAERRRWLKQLILLSFGVTVLISIALCVMYVYFPRFSGIRYLFAAATPFIYWISYRVMCRPEWFSPAWRPGYAEGQNGHVRSATAQAVSNERPNGKKYYNSALKTADSEQIIAALHRVMRERRPYLDPELGIDALAALVGTNRHKLSQAINESLQKNFYDYLNEYRVEAAAQLLSDPANDHLKIAAIAYDAGFNALSTFNEAFKKLRGQTPSEFRRATQNAVSS